MPTCTGPECSRKAKANGLCSGHDAQRRRGRELKPLGIVDPNRGCAVVGCKRTHDAKGYCSHHYWIWHNGGDPHTGVTARRAYKFLNPTEPYERDYDATDIEPISKAEARIQREIACGQRCPRCALTLPCLCEYQTIYAYASMRRDVG